MANLAIIGCGYVGRAVAQVWQQQGHTVTVTTTTESRIPELETIADRAIVLHGEDEAGWRSLLPNQTAVLVCMGARNADSYESTYLGTATTLAKVLPEMPTVQQVIYTGSYAVYGDHQGAWVDETTPVAPVTRNGEILAATEQVLLSAAHSALNICIFRLGGIYGEGRELAKIYHRVAGTIRPGTGQEAANWVHLDDIVGAIAFAYEQHLQGVYNLVCTVPLTVGEVIDRVCMTHNLPPVTWDASLPNPRSYNARVSNHKLRSAGYQFLHPEIFELEA
ncbi:SDR family oxidoreductase [Pantanalinema rosaneae CENA516]|uniref:SDR family oxidoreductase n=1 Tax=Pantanalinema rosaneae TaxID=1620701 RepID=UPI003D6E97FA